MRTGTRNARNLFFLSIATVFVFFVFVQRNYLLDTAKKVVDDYRARQNESRESVKFSRLEMEPPSENWRNLPEEEMDKMSRLGRWLLSADGSPPPTPVENRTEPYLILVWETGPYLERRHIKHFTDHKFSPWESCSVNNCRMSYESGDLPKADAVIFHLHRTVSAKKMPNRTVFTQRWVFLTDESPYHTFLNGPQKLSSYNGMFNWSMTYRLDSDVPVPYGRVVAATNAVDPEEFYETLMNIKRKNKMVAVMGSNCGGQNDRWKYARELKEHLGKDIGIYGGCLNGNKTACPGHFTKDCEVIGDYKFYLAFENSNCRGYFTEKLFWNAYHKGAVPVIMGPTRSECQRYLPPDSYIHVQDFADSATLANYLRYLDRQDSEYLKFHAWRRYFKVLNEHGYFQSVSKHYCRLCEALNYNERTEKSYDDLDAFWSRERDCVKK